MNTAVTTGPAIAGVDGALVPVEAALHPGPPAFVLSGLAEDTATAMRDRVRAAIINAGLPWPHGTVTVTVGRQHGWHTGSALDLAVAVAILAAAGTAPQRDGTLFIGELGLDGAVRPVRAALPMALAATRASMPHVVVPQGNLTEVHPVPGVHLHAVGHLGEAIAMPPATPHIKPPVSAQAASPAPKAAHQPRPVIRDALLVAAAGGHHLALLGHPHGNRLAASYLRELLPDLGLDAALAVASLYSLAGRPRPVSEFGRPPLQAPHHTISPAALVGGGSGIVRPGALSLAHHGVLHIADAEEFPRQSIDAIATCLRDGRIVLGRAHGVVTLPARCQLVISTGTAHRHLARLLDRIEVQIGPHPDTDGMPDVPGDTEPAPTVRASISTARHVAEQRWAAQGFPDNAHADHATLTTRPFQIPPSRTAAITRLTQRGTITSRGHTCILRLAWTLADLGGRTVPSAQDVQAAIHLHTGARP